MFRNRFAGACALALVGLWSAAAAGGVVGEWQVRGEQSIKVEYQSDTLIRLSFGEGGGLLIKGDRQYLLQRLGGDWRVVDLSALKQMGPLLQMLGQQGADPGAVDLQPPEVSVEPLGRRQSVAGIEGEVYRITVKPRGGEPHEVLAVLTEDRRVTTLQRALVAIAQRHLQSMGLGDMVPDAVAQLQDKGLLRYGKELELKWVEEREIPPSRFELPAPPTGIGLTPR